MSRPDALSAGWTHTVLVSDTGLYYGWGIGAAGQLGSDAGYVKFPAARLRLGDSVKELETATVACGSHHTLILSDGEVFSMGSTLNGRLGHGATHGVIAFPNEESFITYVAAGTDFSVAIGEDRVNLYAWGLGKYGNLGDGDHVDRLTPVLFHLYDPHNPSVKMQVSRVSCGARHSLAVCDTGDVFSWGSGSNGRLGHGDAKDLATPKRIEHFVLSQDQRVLDIVAGDSHSMARTKDGRVYTWGSGSFGRLGLGAENDQYFPKIVEKLRDVDVTHISTHTFHCMAVVDPGNSQKSSLYMWGGGAFGKLGIGTTENAFLPVEVPFFRKKTKRVVNAKCGLHHSVVVSTNGRVYTWGYAAKFRCGIENPTDGEGNYFSTPQHVRFFDSEEIVNHVVQERFAATKMLQLAPKGRMVSSGRAHSLAVADGRVYAWGENMSGQLGTGFHKQSFKPIPVGVPTKRAIIEVACGGRHSICIEEWGSVFTWGDNSKGQLGIGNTKTHAFPVLVEALQGTKITHVYAGERHSAAVDTLPMEKAKYDTVAHGYVWGDNTHGQLGLGAKVTVQTYPAPLKIADGRQRYNSIQFALGHTHTLIACTNYKPDHQIKRQKHSSFGMNSPNIAIRARIKSSFLFACGSNAHGQLGLLRFSAQECARTPMAVTQWEGVHEGNSDDDEDNNPIGNLDVSDDDGGSKKKTLPFIKTLAAGEKASIAVVYQDRLEEMFAWGTIPGLEPRRRLVPKRVEEFDHDQVQDKLGIANSIHHLSFLQVSCGDHHSLALLKYNNDRRVVFAWGETKYGKLGVGNVARFNEKIRDRENLKKKMTRALSDQDAAQDNAADSSVSYLPPSHVAGLDDKDVTYVSCYNDHSLSTTKAGTVFAWGYGEGGRLGLGESDDSDRSQQEPVEVPTFYYAPQGAGLIDVDEEKVEDFDEEKDAYDSDENDSNEDLNEEEIRNKQAKRFREEQKERLADEEAFDSEAEAELSLDEDDEDIIMQLTPKYMPKERFAVIQHANNLLQKKQQEYNDFMSEYLEELDALERTQDIVEKAVSQRITQSRLDNPNLHFVLPADEESDEERRKREEKEKKNKKKKKKKKSKEEEAREAAKRKKEADERRRKKEEQLRAEMLLGLEEKQVIPKSLTPIEETIGRFFLAPCLFKDLYEQAAKFLREELLFPEGMESLKDDFEALVFSVYNLHFPSDQRLFKVFFTDMLKSHIYHAREPEEILAPKSLEYRIFKQIFRTGKLKKKVRELWSKPFADIARRGIRDPCEHLRNYMSNPDEMESKAEESILQLVKLTGEVFDKLTHESINNIMAMLDWLVDVLDKAFDSQSRNPHDIIGRRIIRALAEVGLEDQDARRSREQRRNLGADLAQLQVATERFILHLLTGVEEAKDHLTDKYEIEEHIFPDKLATFWEHPEREENVHAFTKYLEAQRLKEEKSEVPINEKLEKERMMLRDFLLMRTTQKRRIMQVPHSSRKLLALFHYFPEDDEHKQYMRGTTNVRLDVFNTGRHEPVRRCDKCHVFHPPVQYPEEEKKKKKNKNRDDELDGPEMDERDIKKKIMLNARVCADLWRTLKEKDFQDIVEEKAGEGAWKELMRVLKKKRHRAFERKNHDAVERYEEASRYLRKIKDAPLGTVVYLASDKPARQEMADPARLFERLREIDEQGELNKNLAIRNVELYMDSVRLLKLTARKSKKQADEMRQAFAYLSGQEADDDLQQFKGNQDKSVKVKTFDPIYVYKERGSVQQYRHGFLKKAGILLDDSDKLNNPKKLIPLVPITWCLWIRTSTHEKNQIKFLDKLDFIFFTTDTDDIFEIKIVFDDSASSNGKQLLQSALVSLAILRGEDEAAQRIALQAGVPADCEQITYIPQGDRVPITRKQTFIFDKERLAEELDHMSRPHPRFGAGNQAEFRAKTLAEMMTVNTQRLGGY